MGGLTWQGADEYSREVGVSYYYQSKPHFELTVRVDIEAYLMK